MGFRMSAARHQRMQQEIPSNARAAARPEHRHPDEHERGRFFRAMAEKRGIRLEDLDVKNDVGLTAGEVYQYLEKNGETQLRNLRMSMEGKGPLLMAALGWLLREDKIDIRASGDGMTVKLK